MKVLWQDKSALLSLILLLFGWLLAFWPSLAAMESVWRGSDTYTHAYAVPLIILWLLTTSNQKLIGTPQPDWRLSLLLLPVLLGWLLGYAAEIAAISQLFAVLALQLLLISWLGFKLAWQLKFPIFYLIFLLPFGEELHPLLQEITADLTVFFLHLIGTPVFREGLYITTPVGHFEVAVACSGLRFLIASLAIGTLFAHLTFQSLKRQLLFIMALVVVSVLANGLRAFVLIWIAEQTNMAYGFGDDHYVYGWLVFALVLLSMFYLGGRFSDFPTNTSQQTETVLEVATEPHHAKITALSVDVRHIGVTLTFFAIFGFWSQSLPLQQAPVEPLAALNWPQSTVLTSNERDDWGISFPKSQRSSLLSLPGKVSIYRAEFAHRQVEGELVGWANQLFNQKTWTIIQATPLQFGQVDAKLLRLKNLAGQERLVIFWYQVGNFTGYRDLSVKLAQLQALLSGNTALGQINAVSVLPQQSGVDQAGLIKLAVELAQTPSLQSVSADSSLPQENR